jgi:hypothetical protein
MMIRIATAVLLMTALYPAAAAACTSPGVKMRDNETVPRIMIVKSGKNCGIRLGSSMGPMETTKTLKAPSHAPRQSMA